MTVSLTTNHIHQPNFHNQPFSKESVKTSNLVYNVPKSQVSFLFNRPSRVSITFSSTDATAIRTPHALVHKSEHLKVHRNLLHPRICTACLILYAPPPLASSAPFKGNSIDPLVQIFIPSISISSWKSR